MAEKNGYDPLAQNVPVIGGHAGITIIPVLSQAQPPLPAMSQEEIVTLTERIQNAGTEVVDAKAGAGSATLSMAFAGARFADNCLTAQSGQNVTEYAFIPNDVNASCSYFSSRLVLNQNGVAENQGLGDLNAYEQSLVEACAPELNKSIEKGVKFAASYFADKN